jgi:predicted DNA binding CopG/RHH family protein
MKKITLDSYESSILQDIENDEFSSVNHLANEIEEARAMVIRRQQKDLRMNLRISRYDLELIKTRAMEEGVPYQTLVTSIVHKYAQGKLKEEG